MKDEIMAMLEALLEEQHNFGTAVDAITKGVSDSFFVSQMIDAIRKNEGPDYYQSVEAIARSKMSDFYKLNTIKKL